MPAHLSLPLTFSSPFSPTFLSHLPLHLSPSFSSPFSSTFLSSTFLPSPSSSNRPTSASASCPFPGSAPRPQLPRPPTQTFDQYGLTPPCCRLNQSKATNSMVRGGRRRWTGRMGKGDGQRRWTERIDGEDGQEGWAKEIDEGVGRRGWAKGMSEGDERRG